MSPRVSIVVPTLNGGETLRQLLAAIAEQKADFDWELLAIDSGSTDETLDVLQEHGASVFSVPLSAFNHGETRNAALARARGEFAVLLVQDAVPAHREWLTRLVAPLLEDNALAGTFARQQPWPHASRLTVHYLSHWVACQPAARTRAPLTTGEFDALPPAERHLACAFDNVCSCIRLSVWRAHPFRSTPIAEDLEWAKEVLIAGYRLAYVPSAVVWHSHERRVRYEFHRTYRVHQRLQSLFGLSTVPTVFALLRAVCTTLPTHVRLAVSEPRRRTQALIRAAGCPWRCRWDSTWVRDRPARVVSCSIPKAFDARSAGRPRVSSSRFGRHGDLCPQFCAGPGGAAWHGRVRVDT
jgi:rhamnosyltransferase